MADTEFIDTGDVEWIDTPDVEWISGISRKRNMYQLLWGAIHYEEED